MKHLQSKRAQLSKATAERVNMRRSIAEAKRSAFTPKRHDFTTARQYVKKTLRDIVLSKTNVWGTIA